MNDFSDVDEPSASSSQNSLTGSLVAGSSQNPTTGGCGSVDSGSYLAVAQYTTVLPMASVPTAENKSGRVILRVDRRFFPHCQEYLSFKTFKIHKRLYYNSGRDRWISKYYQDNTGEIPDIGDETSDETPPISFGVPVSDSEDDSEPFGIGYESLYHRGNAVYLS